MTGGQVDLLLKQESDEEAATFVGGFEAGERPALRVLRANAGEVALHEARLAAIREQSGTCVWEELDPSV
jgi:DNA polymerase-3 subunit epsilon